MIIKRIINTYIIYFFIGIGLIKAQKSDTVRSTIDLSSDTISTINLKGFEEKEESVALKKKRKKRVFYGLKTKKGFTKRGSGDRALIELFYVLKDFEQPNKFVRDIYWYDPRDRVIKKSKNLSENAKILHGPYKKMLGDQIIEEGIFYKGTKHGRWMLYNSRDILIDKEKYYRGWPKESIITWYDEERTKVKEVIPIEYGKKEGYYYLFYDNGQVAVHGEYIYDQKVGVWKEYHKYRRKRKKEIQYCEDPFNEDFTPYILREWDKEGNLLYKQKP